MDRSKSAQPSHELPRSPDDRLDSWKEIAAYLRRDESTVRRWEKDGLPVHRHQHKFRAAVFAYKSELDAWWNNARDKVREGLEGPTPEALPEEGIQESNIGIRVHGPGRRTATVAFVLFVLALLAVGGFWIRPAFLHGPGPRDGTKLAVLPLANLSGDPNEQYFSDGLTEEIITELSRLQPSQLRVIARTSSMYYQGTRKRVDEIGRELQVDYILEGSVRKAAGRVRISIQLIRVSDQTHIWAETYERDARDILALQSSVAGDVAREIRLNLTAQNRADLAKAPPVNPKAHELYLRGRYLWNQRTKEGLEKSIVYFEQAIEEDPTYAASYAALADAYNVSGNWGLLPPKEAYPRAKAAAAKALEINGRLAEARFALAYASLLYDWNPAEAERQFKQALELNANYAPGHQWYAVCLASQGKFDEAIAQVTRARELDPLSLIIGDVVGWVYSLARKHDQAILEFHKAIELDRNFYPAHYDLGMAYVDKGMHKEAIAELELARTLSRDTPRVLSGLAYACAMAGQKARARKLLDDLRKLSTRAYVAPFDIAVVYGALGENDQAFAWLEKAYEDHHPWLVMLRVTSKVDRLRPDPRFDRLCERVGPSPQNPKRSARSSAEGNGSLHPTCRAPGLQVSPWVGGNTNSKYTSESFL